MNINMEFKGKTILVLQGDKRIGKAITAGLAGQGANVIVLAGDIEDIKTIVAGIKSVDILINYMDSSSSGENKKDWQVLLDCHLKLFYQCSQTVIPLMIKQGKGKIINVGDTPVQGAWKYMAVKNEITEFTKNLARNLAKKNIVVNAVIPGPVEGEDYSEAEKTLKFELDNYFPMQRKALMEEIVAPVLFLASDKASYIYGQTLIVDAGFTS